MHLLLLNPIARGLGEYYRALQFARQLRARGHQITLMIASHDKRFRSRRLEAEGFTIIETPHWAPGLDPQEGWGPLDVVFRSVHGLRTRVDLVYSFSHKPNAIIPARLARLRWSCPWVSDWCDWWGGPEGIYENYVLNQESFHRLPSPIRAWRRMIFGWDGSREVNSRRSADLVTVICSDLAERGRREGLDPSRMTVIPSGAPHDFLHPGDKAQERERLGLSHEEFILGYMANAHMDEDLLLGAFALLLETHPHAKMLVMGPPFDHPERHLSPEQREKNLRVLGRVPFRHIGQPMAACDVLLMPLTDIPLNRGRWPNKIGDYLSAGRPVVTNAVGDAPDLVKREQTGWVGSAKPEGYAEAMRKAWEERDQWHDMGQRARRCAETTLDWGHLTDRLCRAIHDQTGLDLNPR